MQEQEKRAGQDGKPETAKEGLPASRERACADSSAEKPVGNAPFRPSPPKKSYPLSIGLVGPIAILNLIGTPIGAFLMADEGAVLLAVTYLVVGLCGSFLLFAFEHAAKAVWDIRDMLRSGAQ